MARRSGGDADIGTELAAPAGWAAAELGAAQLGDRRRTRRLVQTAEALAAQPSASIPQACGSWASTKGAYRLFDLPAPAGTPADTVPRAIVAAHARATGQRLATLVPDAAGDGDTLVLAVQDSTELDYSAHPDTDGLGPLGHSVQRGLVVHSTLAVTVGGQPLGLLAQQVWARDPDQRGQARQRRQRPTAAKESQKWLEALEVSRRVVPEAITLVHVGDREADLYDLFALARQRPHTAVLVRAAQDRRLANGRGEPEARRLWARLEQQPLRDTRELQVPRTDTRPARVARLELRLARVRLRPPKARAAAREELAELEVSAALVRERVPPAGLPAGAPPIEWLLVTTLGSGALGSGALGSGETAEPSVAHGWQWVQWYGFRWRVERYHLILKSGCRIEARQLGTAARLSCCVALYAVIASWLLVLTYQARTTPEAPALGSLLRAADWTLLWQVRHPGRSCPTAEPTLQQALRELAGLGGFLGRRGDGEPGPMTLWRGLMRWYDVRAGAHLAHRLPPAPDVGNE